MLTTLHENHHSNIKGLWHKKVKILYNPKSNYVYVLENCLYTYCDNNGHFKISCTAKFKVIPKNIVYFEKKTVKLGSSLKNARLSGWAKKLIHPFTQKKKKWDSS